MTYKNDGSDTRSNAPTGASAVGEAEPKNPAPTKPASEADLEQVKEQMSGFERSTLRWTRASFGIVLATAVFIALQWNEMRTGGRDTHDLAVAAGKQADRMRDMADRMKDQASQTKTLADQAVIQAEAAQQAVRSTRTQMLLDQRAWLGVTHFSILPPDASGTIRMRIEVSNTGKTPAVKVSYGTINLLHPRPLLLNPPQDAATHIVLVPNAPVPPQGKIVMNVELDISGSNYSAVKDKTKIMYQIGRIRYSDIFGERHTTNFFEYLNAPDDQFMSTCEGGNSMD